MGMLLRRAMMGSLTSSSIYDPYFEQVVALLHADGSNGGTTFVDSSGLALSYTQSGATTSTTQSKFGTTSGALLTNSSYVLSSASMPAVGALQDFTDEGWFRVENFSAAHILMLRGTIAGAGYEIYTDLNGAVRVYGNGAEICATGSSAISLSTWFHCALTRAGGVWKIWINGVLGATSSTNNLAMTGQFQSGASASYGLNGYFDDIRSTLSVARYTTTFTPPTTAFPEASAAATTYATWDPNAKSAAVGLSGGNLIATGNGAGTDEQFRGTVAVGNGKWYWEQTGANCAGIGNALASLADGVYPGQSINSVSYNQTGDIYAVGTTVTNVGGFVGTDIIGIALDMTTRTITFYKNNVFKYAYVHSVPGAIYPISTVYGGVAGPCTANFGATALTYAPPAGFTAGFAANTRYTTWNPSDKASNVVLSNGNLTQVNSTAQIGVRATIGKTSGKWYWEITRTSTGESNIGIGTASASLNSWLGSSVHGVGYDTSTGELYKSVAVVTGLALFNSSGDTMGIALDQDAGTVAFYKNGVLQTTYTHGLSGAVFPMIGAYLPSQTETLNGGQFPFKYTVPTGFNPGVF